MTVTNTNSTSPDKSLKTMEKHLQRLVTDGRNFFKSCGLQLQYMNDKGLLNKGGLRVQKHIQKHQETDLESKAVIAFIGESGAGKSTLLNALLDYENIVPTSGMRACTSVATEFSSRTLDMKSKFYAVIEYVDRQEFEKEVEILRQDIIEDEENAYETDDVYTVLSSDDEEEKFSNSPAFKRCRLSGLTSGTSANVATDKMKALFPKFKSGDFLEIESLIKDLYERNEYLSAGKQIIASDEEEDFVEQVHALIANHEDDEEGDEAHLWPLIKVLKIHLDAEILRSDAILVDLPGLKDNNAARATVAQTYMAKANEIIIVSKLTRVLTDETTAALAEMGYAKQIQYDGRQRVTIVCSFSDLACIDFKS
ncbi:hypothetical protein ABW20_dc0110004 [Dactylellina cionopaga]|nr:hypothetical protein ABW20_dc0110004 [Dactylellina cionopaga]